ncbi:Vacuolar protein sorting-associated protein 20 [Blyttiomyces sp. JEL0837]|nr:Vacuolar protein sorting-associated protein 20 [Blyttiomyces sp. JEL0837]
MGGKSSKVVITPHDKAILDLKVQRDKLKQYQRKLEAVLNRETEVAKQCLRNNDKRRALIALKMKKYQESLLQKTDMQLFTLEQMTQTIEYSLIEKDIITGLQKGNEVLQQIQKEMSVEKVQKIMDDTADGIAYQNEIDETLSGAITQDDLEECEEELEALLRAEFDSVPKVPDSKLPGVEEGSSIEDTISQLPDVPQEIPAVKVKGKEKARKAEEPLAA